MKKTIFVYKDKTGKEPFTKWLYGLKDERSRRLIFTRLQRIQQGNYGDCKQLRNGLFELRLFTGPGYRIYFGEDGNALIILLYGGTKNSQIKDIQKALTYWNEYNGNART